MSNALLFIEANTTGTGMLALYTAAQLGFTTILLTNSPQRYTGLASTPARVVNCDTSSLEATIHAIESEIGSYINGVTTTSEFYLELTAQVASRYSVVGNSPAAMRTCRNKALTRQALARDRVYQPHFVIVQNKDDLGAALSSIGLPCVIKPVDDTGSNMVRLCATTRCAAEHTREILGLETNVRGQPSLHTALVEEYLDAPEYSVEMFTWQGETTCIGITEKHLIGVPYFVEHRHFFPAGLAEETVGEITATVRRALHAVGISFGPTHTEVKLTPRGCAIIEINARLAGGMIPELVRHATGVDLLEQQIAGAAGRAPQLQHSLDRCAGIQFVVSPQAGTFATITGVETARELEGVQQVVITARPGTLVAPPRSAYDRLGFVIAAGSSYADTARHLSQATAQLQLVLT